MASGFETRPNNGLRILNKDLTRFLKSPFFLVELSMTNIGFILEGLPHYSHVKKLGIVAK